jgi:alkylated DNA repair dioxygenase AlkB
MTTEGQQARDASNGKPPGLKLAQDVITPEEETQLIELIETAGLAYKSYDAGNPRSSVSYGWTYDFVNDTFVRCEPLPEGFRNICRSAAEFAGIAPEDLVECLLNRYEPGAVIQPHKDKPVWEHVVGVSLGSSATMDFRKKIDGEYKHRPVELLRRSMYLLTGEARHVFEHSLPPMTQTRWSITFRSYSEEGRQLRDRSSAAG